jgi:glutamate dehydrogenase/leucine dehydrogenase
MTELSILVLTLTFLQEISVGGREVGYMFGQYKRLRNEFTFLTGKEFRLEGH